MKVIHSNILPLKGYNAITILWFIVVRKGTIISDRVINHEKIHWEQEKEMLIIFFYLWYIIEYLVRFLSYRNWEDSYYRISFEREAYINDVNSSYLKSRKRWSWIKHL